MVLLFAALRPVVPHALTVDLPSPPIPGQIEVLSPPMNRLVVLGNDLILWNGETVSDRQLSEILQTVVYHGQQPALHFSPESDASYGRVLEVMGLVHEAGLIDRCFRFDGIARYRHYEKPHDPDELLEGGWRGCAPYYGY